MNDASHRLTLRRADFGDIEAIVGLLADDPIGRTREDPGRPPNTKYLEAFAAVDKDPNQLLGVAAADRAVVGCLQLTFIPGMSRLGQLRGQIEGVRVARTHRRLGTGRAMLDWAIAECKNRGCGLVQLTMDKSRHGTRRFYEDLGFIASHEGMKLHL